MYVCEQMLSAGCFVNSVSQILHCIIILSYYTGHVFAQESDIITQKESKSNFVLNMQSYRKQQFDCLNIAAAASVHIV